MLDGRIARMTGTTSAFGVEFDSLADIISFGVAPAILTFAWGLQPLGRLGWAAGFLFLASAAVRLARFNIQTGSHDKRYFVGMPSPAAAGVLAATVFAYPAGFQTYIEALPVLAMIIVPALLMVSTVRFRSFLRISTYKRVGNIRCCYWWRSDSCCWPRVLNWYSSCSRMDTSARRLSKRRGTEYGGGMTTRHTRTPSSLRTRSQVCSTVVSPATIGNVSSTVVP